MASPKIVAPSSRPTAPRPPSDAAAPRSPAPRPAEPAAAARPSGAPGFITIDSSPVYATVAIDGKDYGETPLVNLSLSPGRHRVRAVSPSGATRVFAIQIEPGKTAPVYRIAW